METNCLSLVNQGAVNRVMAEVPANLESDVSSRAVKQLHQEHKKPSFKAYLKSRDLIGSSDEESWSSDDKTFLMLQVVFRQQRKEKERKIMNEKEMKTELFSKINANKLIRKKEKRKNKRLRKKQKQNQNQKPNQNQKQKINENKQNPIRSRCSICKKKLHDKNTQGHEETSRHKKALEKISKQ